MSSIQQLGNTGDPSLKLVAPNPIKPLNSRKWLKIKRTQDLLEGLGWLTVLFVIFTFLIDGGAQQIVDLQTALGSLNRLSALVATDLLLIQILLIARVPWLERLYGHDRATLTHKRLGKPILYLVILHFVSVTWSYAIADSKNIFDELFAMISTSSDLLLASIAFALMITVVVTSIKISRKKLSYETWYLVHLLAYGSVMLAIPHQLTTGSDIAGKPVAQMFWISLYLFVGLNILWFRLLSPIVLSGVRGLKISAVEAESGSSASIYVSGRRLDKLLAKSGQFFVLRIVTWKHWWRAHPFSLSAAPTSDTLRFTIGNRGDDTALMQTLKPGTRVILEGPFGVFTEDRRTKEKVVLIAAGIGAPPIRALAENISAGPKQVSILFRVKGEDDAPLIDELTEIANRRSFDLFVLAGQRKNPSSWLPKSSKDNLLDEQQLIDMCPEIANSDVYICGPSAFNKAVIKSLNQLDVPNNQIHSEEFAW